LRTQNRGRTEEARKGIAILDKDRSLSLFPLLAFDENNQRERNGTRSGNQYNNQN
jgi:hypothetical protein